MGWRSRAALAVCMSMLPAAADAQVAGSDDAEIGWATASELSIVVTGGNTSTQTFGFKNTVRRNWDAARLRVRFDGVRSKTAGDRFLLVTPGIRFPVGGQPEAVTTSVMTPDVEPDVEQYFVEGRLDRDISERFFWHAGSSWDRNNDAGILNRHILFGGVGNTWFDDDTRALSTSYGVSYTDREETEVDPLKDKRFGGLRFNSDYRHALGGLTTFDGDFTLNMSLADAADYSVNVTNAVGVALTDHLSLRVSLQFLYEHEPALEDAAIVARVAVVDPDRLPGSGDEMFETLAGGGTSINLGKGQIRKDPLDTVLRTALVISF